MTRSVKTHNWRQLRVNSNSKAAGSQRWYLRGRFCRVTCYRCKTAECVRRAYLRVAIAGRLHHTHGTRPPHFPALPPSPSTVDPTHTPSSTTSRHHLHAPLSRRLHHTMQCSATFAALGLIALVMAAPSRTAPHLAYSEACAASVPSPATTPMLQRTTTPPT